MVHGRRPSQLLAVWVSCAVGAGATYALAVFLPAFADLVLPVYVIIGLLLLTATWRWIRGRHKGQDRRHGDRRHTLRRERDGSSYSGA